MLFVNQREADPDGQSQLSEPSAADEAKACAGKRRRSRTWAELSPLERNRAKQLWSSAVNGPDSLNVASQGRPVVVDPALVLWCSRVLKEASGVHLKFARHWEGGRPRGLEAFMVVLRASQASLTRLAGAAEQSEISDPRHSETIVQILKLDRGTSDDRSAGIFRKECVFFELGTLADDVASSPQMFRYAVMKARVKRHQARKPKSIIRRPKPSVPD